MQTPESTSQEVSPGPAEAIDVDLVEVARWEGSQRLWLKQITDLMRTLDQIAIDHPNDAVQTSLNRMYSAACERAVRILRSDMIP